MRRNSTMTLGFVLIFLGIQFALVDSYQLTPRFANFLAEQRTNTQIPQQQVPPNLGQQSPYSQIGYQVPLQLPPVAANIYSAQRTIAPPRWLCWPMLFCGTVVLLHGLAKPHNH